MPTTITANITDVTGRPDNTPWKFASVLRRGEDDTLITGKVRSVTPTGGIFTVELDPGLAIVTHGENIWTVTVPETDTNLWDLIEDAVAYPPVTSQERLNTAVGQYVETNRAQFRTKAVPVVGDPTMAQWVDANGDTVGDPVPWDQVVSEAIAAAATDATAPTSTDAYVETLAPQVIADPDNPSTHIRIQLGGAVGPPAPASATWLSVDGVQQAAYDLDTTPPSAADVGAYTTTETDDAIIAALAAQLFTLLTGENNGTVLSFVDSAGADSYLQINNGTSGSGPTLVAAGAGANRGFTFIPSGSGGIAFYLSGGQTAARFIAAGTATDIDVDFITQGAGVLKVNGVAVPTTPIGIALLDFGSVPAQSFADLTVTVTGAVNGDSVALGVPSEAITAGIVYSGWVSSANTVTIRAHNYTSGALDPAAGYFKATVIK